MPALSDLFKNMLNYIPNVVVAIVMLMIGVLVGDSLRKGIETTGKSLGIPSASILANAFFYFILINFLMAALGQLNIDTQFIESNILIAVAGISLAFAIGYGLASKNILANLVSGFYTKDKFSIGDEITVDGARGQIIKMDRSSLTLLQANNEKTIVPMSKLTNDNVIIHKEALDQLETIEVKSIESVSYTHLDVYKRQVNGAVEGSPVKFLFLQKTKNQTEMNRKKCFISQVKSVKLI